MAHYAIIRDGIVEHVITGVDETVMQDGVGGSTEAWEAFYAAQPWWNGATVRRCSYNGNIRYNYPGIGYTYDADRDAFIAPKPDNAIGLDEETCTWIVPEPEL
jgi:hypothetical protein